MKPGSRLRRRTSHTAGAAFQARLLDNQEGGITERYVFQSTRRDGSNADVFGADSIISIPIRTAVEMSSMEN